MSDEIKDLPFIPVDTEMRQLQAHVAVVKGPGNTSHHRTATLASEVFHTSVKPQFTRSSSLEVHLRVPPVLCAQRVCFAHQYGAMYQVLPEPMFVVAVDKVQEYPTKGFAEYKLEHYYKNNLVFYYMSGKKKVPCVPASPECIMDEIVCNGGRTSEDRSNRKRKREEKDSDKVSAQKTKEEDEKGISPPAASKESSTRKGAARLPTSPFLEQVKLKCLKWIKMGTSFVDQLGRKEMAKIFMADLIQEQGMLDATRLKKTGNETYDRERQAIHANLLGLAAKGLWAAMVKQVAPSPPRVGDTASPNPPNQGPGGAAGGEGSDHGNNGDDANDSDTSAPMA